MNTEIHNLAVQIYDALNKKGAGLGNASIGIIKSAIEKSAQQSFAADGLTPRQNFEVSQIVEKAIRNAFNEFARH